MQHDISMTVADICFSLRFPTIRYTNFFKRKYVKYLRRKGRERAITFPYVVDYPIQRLPFLKFNMYFRNIACSVLKKHGGLILHGSALVHNNLGYVFVGPPGAGKSTMRKLFSDYTCLGDDTAIVRKVGKRYYMFGSPFYQKTNIAYSNVKIPLRGVYILKQATITKLVHLSYAESLSQILANTFMSTVNSLSDERTKTISLVMHMIDEIPIVMLNFEKKRSLLESVVFRKPTT
ncbi:MAG: hypothetical protein AAB557_02185 [Patescibacteria group bacterium]